MSDQEQPKFSRQGKPAKATEANQALIAAVSLLSASLGVTAATPTDAGAVEVHTQVQSPKIPPIRAPAPGTPKVSTKTYPNSLKLQSNQDKIQSNQDKFIQSNQDKVLQSNQGKVLQSNQDKFQSSGGDRPQ
jgi:hypothetical protein